MLRILHTNDLHGKLNDARETWLADLRRQADLYFDSGDAIKAGNLGVPLDTEPVWGRLARLQCTASSLGNRETHVMEPIFRLKVQGAKHPILCANMKRLDGARVLPSTKVVEAAGLRVGIFAVMVPMVTERMAARHISMYLWDPPIAIAQELAASLRPRVDVVIALTHIGLGQDRELARSGADIDIILGGHSHDVLMEPVQEGRVWIAQGGSHGRYAGLYQWDGHRLTGGLQAFPSS